MSLFFVLFFPLAGPKEGHSGCGAQFAEEIRLIRSRERARSHYRCRRRLAEPPDKLVIYSCDPKGRAGRFGFEKKKNTSALLAVIRLVQDVWFNHFSEHMNSRLQSESVLWNIA